MFTETARYYDLFYEKGLGKDYAVEASTIAARFPEARSLLDVACGTGLHLQRWRKTLDCVGVDLDPDMLEIARERCPDVPLVEGDMVDFDLGRRFDIVVCLFSSIGYARTEQRLQSAVATMADHLEPDGTLVVEPWLTPDAIIPGHIGVLNVDEPGLKMTRMNVIEVADGVSTLDMHYLIGTPDGIEHAVETHVLGLFTEDAYREAFERAGLRTTIETGAGPMGRGLVLGRKDWPRT